MPILSPIKSNPLNLIRGLTAIFASNQPGSAYQLVGGFDYIERVGPVGSTSFAVTMTSTGGYNVPNTTAFFMTPYEILIGGSIVGTSALAHGFAGWDPANPLST